MLGHRGKDAVSLAGVLRKDQSCCLGAKEGPDVCHGSTLPQASNQAATWQQDAPNVELGLLCRQETNTVKKIGLVFFFCLFCNMSSLLERGSAETPFQQEK